MEENIIINFREGSKAAFQQLFDLLYQPHEILDSTLNDKVYLHLNNNFFRQNNLTLTSKLIKKINAKNTVTIGLIIQDMSYNANRMTSDFDTKDSLLTIDKPYSITKNNLILSQVFFQIKHNITDLVFFNAGVNGLYFHYNNTHALDPRAGVLWQFSEKQNVGIGYGLHSQMQPLNVYFIQSKTGLDVNGKQVYSDLGTNKHLDFTKSHQFAISHNYSFNTNLRLKTEVYYQYLHNVPVKFTKGYFSMINIGAAMSVPEEDSLINNGYGKNYGIECTFEKFLSKQYYFLVTTSLFNSLYKGSDNVWRNTAYNGHFVINALGGTEFNMKENVLLRINLRSVYAGGRRIIPYDLEKSISQNSTYYLYDQAYEKQLKNYFRIDFRIGILFQRKSSSHEIALDIVNVTNNKNVYREKYNYITQQPKQYYQQGIFPMGLYRFNF